MPVCKFNNKYTPKINSGWPAPCNDAGSLEVYTHHSCANIRVLPYFSLASVGGGKRGDWILYLENVVPRSKAIKHYDIRASKAIWFCNIAHMECIQKHKRIRYTFQAPRIISHIIINMIFHVSSIVKHFFPRDERQEFSFRILCSVRWHSISA